MITDCIFSCILIRRPLYRKLGVENYLFLQAKSHRAQGTEESRECHQPLFCFITRFSTWTSGRIPGISPFLPQAEPGGPERLTTRCLPSPGSVSETFKGNHILVHSKGDRWRLTSGYIARRHGGCRFTTGVATRQRRRSHDSSAGKRRAVPDRHIPPHAGLRHLCYRSSRLGGTVLSEFDRALP